MKAERKGSRREATKKQTRKEQAERWAAKEETQDLKTEPRLRLLYHFEKSPEEP